MRKGFTLVEIMIVVAIVALLAAIAIPNLLRARVNANMSHAQATLRTLSTAAESFAAANNGNYPTSMAQLTGVTPPYLNEDYTDAANNPIQGYTFSISVPLTTATYDFGANPTSCTSTGTASYEISEGGVLLEDPACVAAP
jgi:prepilin-type N-terminal cleavage/methylation domain-containing protein